MMSIFRIHYLGQFLEHSETRHQDLQAETPRGALQRFLGSVRQWVDQSQLDDGDLGDLRRASLNGQYSWWDGDWLFSYRLVERIGEEACSTCSGTGVV